MQANAVTVGADEWLGRTGKSWAAEWQRTDRSFAMLTERLLKRSREFPFQSVLDIGCGAGELSLAIARGRPQCQVIGVDISPQLVGAARERAANHANVSFDLADAASWRPTEAFTPDLLISRHGVMFFADPVAAFTNLREVGAPDAGLLFSCFRAWGENPAFADVAGLLPNPPSPPATDAPGPFAFSDSVRVEGILAAAGWSDIAFEPYDFGMIVGGGENPIEDALEYFAAIGPAARAMSEMDDAARTEFVGRLRDHIGRNLREGIVSLRAAAWIVTARRR